MKSLILLIILVATVFSYFLSQRPFVSDLFNYSELFNLVKSSAWIDVYSSHYDKGYVLINFIFSRIPFMEFRGFLFFGLIFIYLGSLNLLKYLYRFLKPLELFCMTIIVLTSVVSSNEVTHFFRQIIASTLLLLVVTSKKELFKSIGSLFVTTIHLGCYPFMAILNLFYIFKNYKTKKVFLPFSIFIINTFYFFVTHFSKIKSTIKLGEFYYEPWVVVFWILVAIYCIFILFKRNLTNILDQDTRDLSVLLVLAWIMMKFVFMGNYFLSLRIEVFSGVFLFLLLLASAPPSPLLKRQQIGLIIISLSTLFYFLSDVNFIFST